MSLSTKSASREAPRYARSAWWFASVTLVGGLFVLGRMPFASGLFPEPWDKLAHVTVFALLTLLLYRAFGTRAALLAATVAISVGGADEIHQLFLAGRTSDFADFFADGVGATLTALVLRRDQTRNR
ncbi:MAG: VanZ family protein [Burkholderiales bacterium]